MAAKWLVTGVATSAAIARASRFGLVQQRPLSLRWSSSAAVNLKASPLRDVADGPLAVPAQSDSVGSDQPEFSTLEGKVSRLTLQAITHKPFNLKNMSPVQAAVLPLLPEIAEPHNPDVSGPPRDLLVKARTGTGKTLAFLVPAIEAREKALAHQAKQAVQNSGLRSDRYSEDRAKRAIAHSEAGVLILSPTRELATQIANEALKLSSHHPGFEVRLFVGGVSKRQQMREWMKGRRDIVVGTPGRIRDVLENEPSVTAALGKAKLFILDEADTLLDMGFRTELDAIARFLPPTPERQTFMFSATVSKGIRDVAREILDKKHAFINCVSDDAPPVHAHIPQHYTVLPDATHQLPHVLRLLAQDQLTNIGKSKTIIFLPTTKLTKLYASFIRELSEKLPAGRRTCVYEMHSVLTQDARTRTSDRFRRDTSGASILVSSDVSARGVDYPGVTRVIQVGIPGTTDLYVHRVGRTGRGGETSGRADIVLLPFEAGFVNWQLHNIPIKALSVAELEAEVNELAASHDSDPGAFAQNSPFLSGSRFPLFSQKVLPGLQGLEASLSSLYEQINADDARQTVASLLGYYSPKASEIRCSRSDILQGLKEWAVQACGLETAPHFSQEFLSKLGYGGQGEQAPRRGSNFGVRSSGYGSQSRGPGVGGGSRNFRGSDNGGSREYGGAREYGGSREHGARADRGFRGSGSRYPRDNSRGQQDGGEFSRPPRRREY
ncbi:P-loop containing nucleoside triphosphate hydrolase protein [Cytidiella melzeri]|nr:P-loop containing nucleoside triphosphate hydrolase protein [Cytidiella melzeri]